MDLQKIFGNLEDSRILIARYADLDSKAWSLKFYVQQYNRKRLFTFLSLIPALILVYMPVGALNFRSNMILFLVVASASFIILRYGIFDNLDRFKRKALWREKQPEISVLTEEMNRLVNELDAFTVLPPRYRTLHAIDTIGNYILDKRIDSLKEGLNLYEDELFKMQQLHNQKFQIQQNYQMMHQNNQMIQQNRKMIRAQAVTNTLLMFGR